MTSEQTRIDLNYHVLAAARILEDINRGARRAPVGASEVDVKDSLTDLLAAHSRLCLVGVTWEVPRGIAQSV